MKDPVEFKDFESFKSFIAEWVMEKQEEMRNDSIAAHYGVDPTKFDEAVDMMVVKIYEAESFTEVLDKMFPHVNGDTKVLIHLYAAGAHMYWKANN